MRLLTACLIIASLALANGIEQVNQIFSEKSFVSKICDEKSSSSEKKCVIREDEKLEGLPLKTCHLNPEKYANTSLLSFAYNNVILTFTDGIDNKIVTVNLKDCSVKEVTLDIDVQDIKEIVFHDDKYYIIFFGAEVCKEFYCKAIYDNNGKIVEGKSVTPVFEVHASSDLTFKTASKGLLMNEYRLDSQVNLYFLPFEGFLIPDPQVMFSVPHGNWYGLSALENKLGFCAFDDGKAGGYSSKKIICQQYDAEGKTKLMESEIQIDKVNHVDSVKVTNFENGMLVMVDEWRNANGPTKHTSVVFIDEHGKQGKPFGVDATCKKGELDQNFFKSEKGVTWLVYHCYNPYNPSERTLSFKCLAEDCYRKSI